jgi:hypothetical protein
MSLYFIRLSGISIIHHFTFDLISSLSVLYSGLKQSYSIYFSPVFLLESQKSPRFVFAMRQETQKYPEFAFPFVFE